MQQEILVVVEIFQALGIKYVLEDWYYTTVQFYSIARIHVSGILENAFGRQAYASK